MKIIRAEMDEEGYIRFYNMIRALQFGLYKGRPALWYVGNPLAKEGNAGKCIALQDDQSVPPETMEQYRGTLIDDKTNNIWHIFEEPSKIIKGVPPPNIDLKHGPKK
jgi:hypothetical protein